MWLPRVVQVTVVAVVTRSLKQNIQLLIITQLRTVQKMYMYLA